MIKIGDIMELKDLMQKNNFVVLGNTIDLEKYAAKIKNRLLESGYNAVGVSKELQSINDTPYDIDVLVLCIHPSKTMGYLTECKKNIPAVVIQPGAESEEIYNYLNNHNIPFINGCVLVGLSLYKK